MRGIVNKAILLLGIVTVVVDSSALSPRNGSSSFAGSNEYFLHALSEAEQKTYVETLAGWGVKVLRLWGELATVLYPVFYSSKAFMLIALQRPILTQVV